MNAKFQFVYCCLFLTFTSLGAVKEATAEETKTLRVMTFNLWHGGDAGGQPIERSAEVIRAAKADLIGLQETAGHAQEGVRPDHAQVLAKQLDFHYFDQSGRTAILSRYPIRTATPSKWGVEIEVPEIGSIYLFNAHLSPAPYQPYQLLSIPYYNGKFINTEEEAIAEAKAARGGQVSRLLAEMRPLLAEKHVIFLTGDFNEPSHHDWTEATVHARHCPVAVQWPTSSVITHAGLKDGFRKVHKDPVSQRGLTWTPLTNENDPNDHHDRIDIIYASKQATAVSAAVIGESNDYASIVVENYPSDHRAVVVEYEVTKTTHEKKVAR